MATLKDDSSSWKAGSLIRRDFRHAKDEPDVPKHKGRKASKRKWCKGKVGKEHVVSDWVPDPHWPWATYLRVKMCEVCGKRLEYKWRE
jgi:hypothetical protein